ncbi:MAG: hypothetical protein ACLR8Y_12970 [Alistipes indistinctus]
MRKYRRFRCRDGADRRPAGGGGGGFFGISWLAEFRPAPVEEVYRCQQPDSLPDTLTLVSWNIGYAGLGDNMDFFYDGGRRVRDTRARTAANLAQIVLDAAKIDADIMLLQEVDRSSHRTYRIDEAGLIGAAFPGYAAAFGFNYKAWFVPIPLRDPIGRCGQRTADLVAVQAARCGAVSVPVPLPVPGTDVQPQTWAAFSPVSDRCGRYGDDRQYAQYRLRYG